MPRAHDPSGETDRLAPATFRRDHPGHGLPRSLGDWGRGRLGAGAPRSRSAPAPGPELDRRPATRLVAAGLFRAQPGTGGTGVAGPRAVPATSRRRGGLDRAEDARLADGPGARRSAACAG